MTQDTLNKLSKNARARVEIMTEWYKEAVDPAQKERERCRLVGYIWGLYDAGFLSDLERRALISYMKG